MFRTAIITYPGFHSVSSSCRILHGKQDSAILFGFCLLKDGMTSPTNMFETLASRCHAEYYPDAHPRTIRWFDIYPEEYSIANRFVIQEVRMTWGKDGKTYWGPEWIPALGVDPGFLAAAQALRA